VEALLAEDSFRGLLAIKKFPKDYVHFTDVNKLGIRPSKFSHRDPPGIYFYPCKWLLQYKAKSFQYGLNKPYFFVARVNLRALNGFNLPTVTLAEVESLAKRNDWYKDYLAITDDQTLLADTPIYRNNKKLLKKPGGLFYAICDYLVNLKKSHPWLQLLRGLDYISDSAGIINDGEPSQLLVFSIKNLKILESGENKNDAQKVYSGIFDSLAKKYKGTLTWKNKVQYLDLTIDSCPLICYITYEGFSEKLNIKFSLKNSAVCKILTPLTHQKVKFLMSRNDLRKRFFVLLL